MRQRSLAHERARRKLRDLPSKLRITASACSTVCASILSVVFIQAHQSGLQRSRPPETKGYQGSDREGLKLPPTGAGVDDVFACGPTRTSPVRVENKVGGAIGTLCCAACAA